MSKSYIYLILIGAVIFFILPLMSAFWDFRLFPFNLLAVGLILFALVFKAIRDTIHSKDRE